MRPLLILTALFLGCSRDPGQLIEVRASEMRFEPQQIHLPGGTASFTLKNAGRVLHDFNIVPAGVAATHRHESGGRTAQHASNQSMHVMAEPGESAVLRAELAPGEYEFYCSVPGHREAGMKGRLMVH